MYTIIKRDGITISIKKEDTNTLIPVDSGNMDYIEYLEWISEGNIPSEENLILE